MPFLKIRDLDRLYYEQAGAGPDVLVISGTGSDLRRHPNPTDSPLTAHYRVTTYDQRGLGQTSKPQDGYTMANYADDAAALIEALGIGPVPAIGISFGGMVLQNLLVRHPGVISKAALWCTSPGGEGGSSYPLHELPDDLSQEERFRAMTKLSDNRVTDAWFDEYPDKADVLRKRADKTEFLGEPNYEYGARMQIEARRGHDCWDGLSDVRIPVQCAGGNYDDIATPLAMKRMAERLPRGQLKLYEGGHMFFIQNPEAYDDVMAFFEGD